MATSRRRRVQIVRRAAGNGGAVPFGAFGPALPVDEAAERIGITGSLNNYQRLENSDTANPVLETLVQIKRAFPDFPLEQIAS